MARIIDITDFSAPELDIYARLTENQLVNRADPDNALFVAESPLVSHSYERKTYERWPYNLYAMMHGKTAEEIEAFVGAFVAENGVEHYEILYSEEELKKTSMVYFE